MRRRKQCCYCNFTSWKLLELGHGSSLLPLIPSSETLINQPPTSLGNCSFSFTRHAFKDFVIFILLSIAKIGSQSGMFTSFPSKEIEMSSKHSWVIYLPSENEQKQAFRVLGERGALSRETTPTLPTKRYLRYGARTNVATATAVQTGHSRAHDLNLYTPTNMQGKSLILLCFYYATCRYYYPTVVQCLQPRLSLFTIPPLLGR